MNIVCNVDEVCFLSGKWLVDEDFAFTGYDVTSFSKLILTFRDNSVSSSSRVPLMRPHVSEELYRCESLGTQTGQQLCP